MQLNAVTWADYRRWLSADFWQPPPVAAPALADLTTDSRTLAPGAWFIPITGATFDGHLFVKQALAQGAAGFFYAASRRSLFSADELARGLAVTDPLEALQQAATGWRLQMPKLKLVALTGSAGKTTTKEMLARILQHAGKTLATQANFNNEIGVPKTLQQLEPDHRFAVLEFGARQVGNIRFLCDMARPDVAGLLNVGSAHVGIFGSVEKLLATKLEIFGDSPAACVQVAPLDDPRILAGARATGKKTLTFGTGAGADVHLEACDWLPGAAGMRVTLRTPSAQVTFDMAVAHSMYGLNAAAAAAMALAAGAKEDSIAAGLQGFSGAKGRYQIHRRGPLTVIDDTYNANPESLAAGLNTVQRSYPGKRIGLVLGDMLELGDGSRAQHYRIGTELIAPLKPGLLLTVGDDSTAYGDGAKAAGYPAAQVQAFASVAEVIAAKLPFEDRCDVLYIKGSNGIQLTKLVDELTK